MTTFFFFFYFPPVISLRVCGHWCWSMKSKVTVDICSCTFTIWTQTLILTQKKNMGAAVRRKGRLCLKSAQLSVKCRAPSTFSWLTSLKWENLLFIGIHTTLPRSATVLGCIWCARNKLGSGVVWEEKN